MNKFFTHQDLVLLRDNAIRNVCNYPSRGRLPDMARDLNTDDLRVLAMFEAAVTTLVRMGVLDPERLEGVVPVIQNTRHEPIEA